MITGILIGIVVGIIATALFFDQMIKKVRKGQSDVYKEQAKHNDNCADLLERKVDSLDRIGDILAEKQRIEAGGG